MARVHHSTAPATTKKSRRKQIRLADALLLSAMFLLSQDTLSVNDGKACKLSVAVWTNDAPFLYSVNNQQTGIFPELLSAIFEVTSCSVDIVYFPTARLTAKINAHASEAQFSLLLRPYNSEIFIDDSIYTSHPYKNRRPSTVYRSISTPIAYPKASLIGLGNKSFELNQPNDLDHLSIGAIRVPHRNKVYWKHFFGLPSTPHGYTSMKNGLKAMAAGRIDLFLSFNAIKIDFITPYSLVRVKEIDPLELILLVQEEGVKKLSESDFERINLRIVDLYNNGTIKNIVKKYSSQEHFDWPSIVK